MNFKEKVWKACSKIPKGKITTYGEIAKALNTKAYRAVGNALHVNPYAPRVPCHRVVNSDGRLGGFASGTKKKIMRLKREGIKVKKGKIIDFEKVVYRF
ncbi:cysteine methyltransferase [Candidatus Woesearchaeota archaeon]|nr:cysteine methyltransferase [Candidatus Woesearchaeota archaeon]|tara:strand:+ start:4246 stop:4542 length:297 start_codon:yes stop_codon:yes gene_type:complete